MIRLMVIPSEDGFSEVIMPLNDGEGVGRMETVIEVEEGNIPQPFRQNILDQLAMPQAERTSGFPGQAWRATSPPGLYESQQARMRQRRGLTPPVPRNGYFYREASNDVIEGANQSVPDSRMFEDVPTGVGGTMQQYQQPTDDGVLNGPMTSTAALAMVTL